MKTKGHTVLNSGRSAFLILSVVWIFFLFSAAEQKQLSWFPLLFSGRVIECITALLFFLISFRKGVGHMLPVYLTACAVLQSIFAMLEGPQ